MVAACDPNIFWLNAKLKNRLQWQLAGNLLQEIEKLRGDVS